MEKSKSFIAIPPGETIKEQLENRKLSQKEFAKRMDLSEKHVSKLINGKVELTQELAYRLESVLGIPAHFWNNLESLYREKLLKVIKEKELEEEKIICSKIPYNEMANLGWVEKTTKEDEKIMNLRNFFEVVNLSLIDKFNSNIVFRKMSNEVKINYPLACWVQRVKIESREKNTGKINLKKLEKIVPLLRAKSLKDQEIFEHEIEEELRKCGIALIFLPHIKGSYLEGASFLNGNYIALGLTVSGKDVDKFWFSLFHEIYHILNDDIKSGALVSDESLADCYARDILIPPEEFENFIRNNDLSCTTITNFAKKIEINPGIIVGRLQKDNYLRYDQYTNLKKHFKMN